MKYVLKSMLTLCLVAIVGITVGQDNFEGVIIYSIEYKKLPQQFEAQKDMLPKEIKVYYKDQKSRMEVESGASNSQVIVSDNKNKVGFVAINQMNQKILIPVPKEKYVESQKKIKDGEVEYLEGEKEIAGYDCKKAKIKLMNTESTVYYTESLPSEAMKDFKKLKGLALQFEETQNGIHRVMTATKVNKQSIDSKKFEKPTGYQEMTIEQIQQMSGQKFDF